MSILGGGRGVPGTSGSVQEGPGCIKTGRAGRALRAGAKDAARGQAALKAKFGVLANFAGSAFGGIKDALAAGDFGLAARILWLSLKLAWQKGVSWLKTIWADFKGWFLKVAADHPDAYFVVARECAVCELLRKRGMPLPYPAWGDFTREVVPRSVFISSELGGWQVPEALRRFPDESPGILRALGRYLARLHAIEFARAGFIASPHAAFAPAAGPVPLVYTWDRQAYHRPEIFEQNALAMLERAAPRLPAGVAERLRSLFDGLADTLRGDYEPPRFTVANCHVHHFHVDRASGRWEVLGFCDFEAASSGAPISDLVELELALTPATGGVAWREPFFGGYGAWPRFESYRRRVLCDLLFEAGADRSAAVPDRGWLDQLWARLIEATDWASFQWYPEGDGATAQS